jgi:PPM family protein phosphatase
VSGLVVVVLAAAGIAGGVVLVRRHRRSVRQLPILVFPPSAGPSPGRTSTSSRGRVPSSPSRALGARPDPPSPAPEPKSPLADAPAEPPRRSWMDELTALSRSEEEDRHAASIPDEGDPGRRLSLPRREADGSGAGSRDASGEGTFDPLADGTLQLLPGSLQVLNGPGEGEIIRFARAPGEEPVITFGRSSGPAYRHVQLTSPTVSRRHARLVFRDQRWVLENESTTNPTVVNGRALDGGEEAAALEDGARIEMGEVVFAFRHPLERDRLALRSSWYTDRGRRSMNQDAVAVRTLPDGRELAVVCDGMGSHASGGVASHIAMEALIGALSEGADLAHGVREANRAVLASVAGEADRNGMGTTLVALLREGDGYVVANVGDSRAYRVDAEGIAQLTEDHSFIAEAVGEGGMSLDDAKRSPWRNAVTRNLGADSTVEVDLFGPFDVSESHVAILCTDGVHGILSDEEMEEVIRTTSQVTDLARALAEAALMKGGEDNVAVAAMAFPPVSGEAG